MYIELANAGVRDVLISDRGARNAPPGRLKSAARLGLYRIYRVPIAQTLGAANHPQLERATVERLDPMRRLAQEGSPGGATWAPISETDRPITNATARHVWTPVGDLIKLTTSTDSIIADFIDSNDDDGARSQSAKAHTARALGIANRLKSVGAAMEYRLLRHVALRDGGKRDRGIALGMSRCENNQVGDI